MRRETHTHSDNLQFYDNDHFTGGFEDLPDFDNPVMIHGLPHNVHFYYNVVTTCFTTTSFSEEFGCKLFTSGFVCDALNDSKFSPIEQ